MKARILIVGGGIMGTSVAIEAARRSDPLREPVVLLERRTIGAGSSGRGGAILRQHYSDRIVAAMARESIRSYASFEARTGRSIGFQRTGVVTIAGPEQTEWIERIKKTVDVLRDLGIPIELVQGPKLRELVPGIWVKKGSIAAWEPDAGHVNPEKTLAAFGALARSYGAVTRNGVTVEEILVEDGRVRGARTSEGEVPAEKVVLVAGPWSDRLLRRIGVEIPMRVIRPENVFFTMPTVEEEDLEREEPAYPHLEFDIEDDPMERADVEALLPRGTHPAVIDLENGFYCRCETASRRVRVGRTDYDHDEILEDPDDLTEEISEEVRVWARRALTTRLPEYEGRSDAGGLAGWYTLTPDAQAVIGPIHQVENLFVATGFSGHGFKLGPSVGLGLAQMLFDEPVTAFEPDFFDPARFRGDEEWTGRFGL